MRLVLDTNILIAALIKDSLTRAILLSPDVECLLPEHALEELHRHRAKIVRHSGLKPAEVDLLMSLLMEHMTIVPAARLALHLSEAETLIGDRDPDDVPFVALALAEENDGIWSNDRAFDGLAGLRVWNTASLKRHLRNEEERT
jgi:predicted nucleic acid-binding protein